MTMAKKTKQTQAVSGESHDFKDSALGKMPEEWTVTTVGEIANSIQYGYTESANEEEIGPKFLRITDIQDGRVFWDNVPYCHCSQADLEKYKLISGDIVFARTGATTGKSFYIAKPPLGVFASYLIRVRVNKKNCCSQYLYLFFQSNTYWNQISSSLSGSAQSGFNASKLSKLLIFSPPLIEQSAIATVLSTVDDAIEKTDQLIAKYQRIKQGLMQDLFRYGIDENGQIRSGQTHRFKDSPLGRIPEEWDVKPLKSICEKIQDGTHFSPVTEATGKYKYITSKNIRVGRLDLSECEYISEKEHLNIYKRCSVNYGDILLTKDGANTGNAVINPLREPFSMLSSIAFIRGNTIQLLNEYLLQYLLSEKGQKLIKDSMKGLAIARVTLDIIKNFSIPLPPLSEQSRIAAVLSATDKAVEQKESYRQKLFALKRGLMEDLLTGKVRTHHRTSNNHE